MFEDEFPSAIGVVESVPFLEMHNSFTFLSRLVPSGLDPSALESCVQQDIHLGGIFATFELVCEACYVYHPHNDLWLVRMRCILDLMFRHAMPFFYHSVAVLDCYFGSDFCAENPNSIAPLAGAIPTSISVGRCGCLIIQ